MTFMTKPTIHGDQAMRDNYEVSSGNVFADLGFSDADELYNKSLLAIKIADVIKERKLTQTQAAEILNIDQPKVSNLIRGKLAHQFSIERLCGFLTKLGYDVDINVTKRKNKGLAQLTVNVS